MTARLVLVHGATSGPWVFDDWAPAFPHLEVAAPDLQDGLDVAAASMADYTARVRDACAGASPVALCGWSMGGLVAMLAAVAVRPAALVVLEPSLPLPLHSGDPRIAPQRGTYDAEFYGYVAPGTRHRPESRFAFDERKRGIPAPPLDCPLLAVGGRAHPEWSQAVADHYGGEYVAFPSLGHTALVRDPAVRMHIADWLRRHL